MTYATTCACQPLSGNGVVPVIGSFLVGWFMLGGVLFLWYRHDVEKRQEELDRQEQNRQWHYRQWDLERASHEGPFR